MNVVPLPFFDDIVGVKFGTIAINHDGSLHASVCHAGDQHCVHIWKAGSAEPHAVFGATHGNGSRQLCAPTLACFTHREHVEDDTLLICDFSNDRIVEVGTGAHLVRHIPVPLHSCPRGVAYCGLRDVIAVSLYQTHAVLLMHYESTAIFARIGGLYGGGQNGFLAYPRGLRFTADGNYVLLADNANSRVSKFDATDGVFVSHIAIATCGISCPTDVLQRDDGSIVVATLHGVVCVRDGIVKTLAISEKGYNPTSLAYVPALGDGVYVSESSAGRGPARAYEVMDMWGCCIRSAWVSSCCGQVFFKALV